MLLFWNINVWTDDNYKSLVSYLFGHGIDESDVEVLLSPDT